MCVKVMLTEDISKNTFLIDLQFWEKWGHNVKVTDKMVKKGGGICD